MSDQTDKPSGQPSDKPARMSPSEIIKRLSPRFKLVQKSGGGCIIGGFPGVPPTSANAEVSEDKPTEGE